MKNIFILFFLILSLFTFATAPVGYYTTAVGKSEAALKTQLFTIVGSHTARTYTTLWNDFKTTDKKSDGSVWDMYSNCTFVFGVNQDSGSGGTAECQFYNREHSFPKSWFKISSGQEDSAPMGTDLFHLYPTDKFVNNSRGNDPFGETASSSQTFINGSKIGSSSFAGYSGVVFEPANEYKGDFARTYSYMVTAYENVVDTWNTSNTNASPHLDGTKYPALTSWTVSLLLKWNSQDPVSQKEIDRNEAVYGVQKNRNPFIDHPELAEYIWGSHKGEPWSLTAGVDELKIEFSVSPNPVRNEITVKAVEADLSYTIFNLNGQLFDENTLNKSKSIRVSQLSNGMYLLQLKSGNRKSIQKFTINK